MPKSPRRAFSSQRMYWTRERARVLESFDPDRFDREGILTEAAPGHWVLRKEEP